MRPKGAPGRSNLVTDVNSRAQRLSLTHERMRATGVVWFRVNLCCAVGG